jgi:hypothetical protein
MYFALKFIQGLAESIATPGGISPWPRSMP